MLVRLYRCNENDTDYLTINIFLNLIITDVLEILFSIHLNLLLYCSQLAV